MFPKPATRVRWPLWGVLVALALPGACAPHLGQSVPKAGISRDNAHAAHLVQDPDGSHWALMQDGTRLAVNVWTPGPDIPIRAVVIGLHGMNDYARTFEFAGPAWAKQGIVTWAYDARGFGRSPDRGRWAGTGALTQDLAAIAALARRTFPGVPLAVVGESMGAATAMVAFGSEDPPDADRVVLVAPAVWGWSKQPVVNRIALWTSAHLAPGQRLTPPRGLGITASDNTAMLRALGRDRLMIFETRIDALFGLVRLMEQAGQSGQHIRVPLLYLYGLKDEIIPDAAARDVARTLPPGARTAAYPNGWHMLLRDLQADVVFADIEAFIADPSAPLPSGTPPLSEH